MPERPHADVVPRDYLDAEASIALLALDGAGNVVAANAFVRELLGFDPSGRSWRDVVVDFDDLLDPGRLPLPGAGEPQLVHVLTFTGMPQTLLCRAVPTERGRLVLGSLGARDVESLRFEVLGLNRELSTLTRSLQRARAELEEKVRLRTAELERATTDLLGFSYAMAHDLKQPLRAMDAYAALLAEELAGRLGPAEEGLLARIRAASTRMTVLTEGLIAMTRVAGRRPDPQPLDLRPLAEEALGRLRASAPARRVSVSLPERALVFADRELAGVALAALLENAWKFTSRRDAARIEVGVERAGREDVVLVRDDGAGFEAADAVRLFEPFQRFHRADEFPGEGIGLALAARAIRSHGGRIWADSAPGRGATFRFSLPVADPSSVRPNDDGVAGDAGPGAE